MEKTLTRKHEIDMVNGNLFKNLIIVALPLLLSGVMQLFYNSCDLIVCNKFSQSALEASNSTAAIASTNSLVNLIVNTFLGLSIGTNILMSRYYGANLQKYAQRNVYTSLILAVGIGLFVGIFGAIFSKYFLIWMGSPEDVIDLSTKYLAIYFLGAPFSMIYNFGSAMLRAVGDTRRPFFILFLSGLFNLGFNILFVVVFKLGVVGVALGTIISQFISALLIVITLCKTNGFFHFKFSELKFYKYEALEIIKIGVPAGLQNCIFSISNVLLQSSINSLGSVIMGASGAANSLEGFVFTSMNSVASAGVAFVSANYGAQRKDNIKKVIFYELILVLIANIVVGGIIIIFRKPLLLLYIQEEALEPATKKMLIIICTYFICGYMDCFAQAQRGIKHPLIPTIVSLIGTCGTRILWIYLVFPIPFFHNLPGLMTSYPASWIVTLITHIILFIIQFKKIKFEKVEDK